MEKRLSLEHAIFLAAINRLCRSLKRPVFSFEIAEEIGENKSVVNSLLNYLRRRDMVLLVDRRRAVTTGRTQARYQVTTAAAVAARGAEHCAGCGRPPVAEFRGKPWCYKCLISEPSSKDERLGDAPRSGCSCALSWDNLVGAEEE